MVFGSTLPKKLIKKLIFHVHILKKAKIRKHSSIKKFQPEISDELSEPLRQPPTRFLPLDLLACKPQELR
jgi:hypothetical protein